MMTRTLRLMKMIGIQKTGQMMWKRRVRRMEKEDKRQPTLSKTSKDSDIGMVKALVKRLTGS